MLVAPGASGEAEELNASAGATITRSIQVTELDTLNFGRITPNNGQATISMAPDGTLTSDNANYVLEGATSPGRFQVFGNANSAITVTISSIQDLAPAGGGKTIPLANLVHDAGVSPTIGGDGLLTINVGGEISLKSGTKDDIYQGSYTITVNYQ